MTPVTLSSLVSHRPSPVAANVSGETVLMNLERNRCYGLGEIGSEIWFVEIELLSVIQSLQP